MAENGSTESLTEAIQRLLDKSPEELEVMKKNILDHVSNVKEEDRISQLIGYYEYTIKNFYEIWRGVWLL